jgi:hypothetical protein
LASLQQTWEPHVEKWLEIDNKYKIIFSKVDINIIGLARCAEVRVKNLYCCINIKAFLFLL